MPFAEQFMVSGITTAAQDATLPATIPINCGFVPTKVWLTNETQYGGLETGFKTIQQVYWDSTNPTVTKLQYLNAAGTALLPGTLASNGITPYNGGAASPTQQVLGPTIAGSNIALNSGSTSTWTVASTATLYPGAVIFVANVSVDKQLGGMYFTVNTVPNSTTFTINNSQWYTSASFTGGAQTFTIQLVTVPGLFYPQNAQIVNISAANPAVVTTSTNTNLTIGQQVRLYVPKVFGMQQANFTTAIISAVSGNQVTLGGLISLNSSAFTAFSWPTASGVPYSPAIMVPIGSGPSPTPVPPALPYNFDTLLDATDNQSYQGFTIGSSILVTASSSVIGSVAGDVYSWTAWRGDV